VRPHVTSTIHLSFALLRDAEGNPSGLVGFSVNITAQKPGDLAVRRTQEVERELQESEAGFVPPVKSRFRYVWSAVLSIVSRSVSMPLTKIEERLFRRWITRALS